MYVRVLEGLEVEGLLMQNLAVDMRW